MEWRFERRRGSSVDRKNTVRHLIQMMAITESEKEDQVCTYAYVYAMLSNLPNQRTTAPVAICILLASRKVAKFERERQMKFMVAALRPLL